MTDRLEAVARAIDPGAWTEIQGPEHFADNEVFRIRSLAAASRAIAALDAGDEKLPADGEWLTEIMSLREALRFLLDRLDDLETSWMDDGLFRDWNGHVMPAISRARAALGEDRT